MFTGSQLGMEPGVARSNLDGVLLTHYGQKAAGIRKQWDEWRFPAEGEEDRVWVLTPVPEAGVVSLQLLGRYDDPRIEPTLDYLARLPAEWGNAGGISWYYYFHYYAIQANYQAGGEYWEAWHPQVRNVLLRHQRDDGSWSVPPGTSESQQVVGANRVYYTSMATLILEIYMHYLPAYQR